MRCEAMPQSLAGLYASRLRVSIRGSLQHGRLTLPASNPVSGPWTGATALMFFPTIVLSITSPSVPIWARESHKRLLLELSRYFIDQNTAMNGFRRKTVNGAVEHLMKYASAGYKMLRISARTSQHPARFGRAMQQSSLFWKRLYAPMPTSRCDRIDNIEDKSRYDLECSLSAHSVQSY